MYRGEGEWNEWRSRFEQGRREAFRLERDSLGAALALFGSADRAGAADRRGSSSGVFVSEMNDVQRVKVIVNKSRTFRVDTAFFDDRGGLA